MRPLAQKIKQAREDTGLSQRALARAIGVSTTAISSYETGQNIPPLPKLMAIAKVLGLEVEVFVREHSCQHASRPRRVQRQRTVLVLDETLDRISKSLPLLLDRHADLLQAQQLARDIRRARHELHKLELERQS